MSLLDRLMDNVVALAAAPLFTPDRPRSRLRALLPDLGGRRVPAGDAGFAVDAVEYMRSEATLARLVAERANQTLVRDLAQQVAADHSSAVVELESLCAGRRITLPSSPSPAAESALRALSALEADELEEAWLERLEAGHDRAAGLFRRQRDYGGEAELAAYAGRMLPIVEEHFRMARHLRGAKGPHKANKGHHKKD